MPERVSPTRMKLLETKKRYSVAIRGHKLLKEKLEALVRELLILTKEFEKQEKLVSVKLPSFFNRLLLFRSTITDYDMEEIINSYSIKLNIAMTYRNLMNINLPSIKILKEETKYDFSNKGISPLFDLIFIEYNDLIAELFKLAEIEASIYALSNVIELTRRRVNALEYVMIPELGKIIKDITSKLDENERSSIIRLMKIKEMLSSKKNST